MCTSHVARGAPRRIDAANARTIAHYAITGTLGEGGMGVVYSAHDERLGRTVAIKMIRGGGRTSRRPASGCVAKRAPRPASTIRPSASSTRSAKTDGELFLAMELLQGESLAARLARGPLPLGEAVSTALGILHGIEALHRAGARPPRSEAVEHLPDPARRQAARLRPGDADERCRDDGRHGRRA